jgi:hypothetical protein
MVRVKGTFRLQEARGAQRSERFGGARDGCERLGGALGLGRIAGGQCGPCGVQNGVEIIEVGARRGVQVHAASLGALRTRSDRFRPTSCAPRRSKPSTPG